jgi:hypothetical protein
MTENGRERRRAMRRLRGNGGRNAVRRPNCPKGKTEQQFPDSARTARSPGRGQGPQRVLHDSVVANPATPNPCPDSRCAGSHNVKPHERRLRGVSLTTRKTDWGAFLRRRWPAEKETAMKLTQSSALSEHQGGSTGGSKKTSAQALGRDEPHAADGQRARRPAPVCCRQGQACGLTGSLCRAGAAGSCRRGTPCTSAREETRKDEQGRPAADASDDDALLGSCQEPAAEERTREENDLRT